ncbi:hypothetical protein GCM10010330_21300 [Streptomyces tendae]|nr:hypothetical protein GCM10010330_21300 [Streptomyces tendae]
MAGDTEDATPAGGDELGGRGEEAEPKPAGFPEPGLAGQFDVGDGSPGEVCWVSGEAGFPPAPPPS